MCCFVVTAAAAAAAAECGWRQGGEWTATLLALKAIAHSTSAHLSYSEYEYTGTIYNKCKIEKMEIYVHIEIKFTKLILNYIQM
jgi:hypothetical protein